MLSLPFETPAGMDMLEAVPRRWWQVLFDCADVTSPWVSLACLLGYPVFFGPLSLLQLLCLLALVVPWLRRMGRAGRGCSVEPKY